ncbi:MAG: NAD(+) diphosphatase [Actinomycetaceae bacterium]
MLQLPLARSVVDEAAYLRGEEGLYDRLRADPTTRVALVLRGEVAVDGDRLLLVAPGDLPGLDWGPERVHLLGRDTDGTYLSAVLPDRIGEARDLDGAPVAEEAELARLVERTEFATIRRVGHRLGDRDAGLATTAVALSAWHRRSPHCPRCGSLTVVEESGWMRRCPADDEQHFPRTDPAVIVALVDDEDRLLLGRSVHWEEARFSTLAGFVESGESAETAVRREIYEEARVEVTEMSYRGSQPWPFPCSLMLGYRARVTNVQTAQADGEEVAEIRLFTREQIRDEAASGRIRLPGRSSIARSLIEEWYGGVLEEPERD